MYKELSCRLRSMTTLRKGLLLYLALVIKGLPRADSTCANCVGSDGCSDIICFDGLLLGYKVKHKRPVKRSLVRTCAIPRASLQAHFVTDTAVAKAFGTVLNTSTTLPVGSSKTVTTERGIRGSLAAQIVAAIGDLRRRTPPALLARVGAVLTAAPLVVETAGGLAVEPVEDEDALRKAGHGDANWDGADDDAADAAGGKNSKASEDVLPAAEAAEDSDGVADSDDDLSSADEVESEND
eukprot:contig_16930_g4117